MPLLKENKHQGVQAESVYRIKSILANFSGENTESLKYEIKGVIKSTMQKLNPEEREAYFEALNQEFPVLSDLSYCNLSTGDADCSESSGTDSFSADNIDQLYSKLYSIYINSNESEKQQIISRFKDSDFGSLLANSDKSEEPKEALSSKDKDESLFPLMSEFIFSLISVIGKILKMYDIKVSWRLSKGLEERLKESAEQAAGYKNTKEDKELKRFKMLVYSVLRLSDKVGEKFTERIVPRLAPYNIEKDIQFEGSNFWKSKEVRCWQLYKDRYREQFSTDYLRDEIRRIQGEELESLVNKLVESS
ncbi:hypothetical protein [Sedimentisphaera salicampi]|uniref:Uncharacterized protein n=1 Tax=Sedimentisphaera salicampi TaxID=1941349 RepID=A0A1W6LMC9_9BACT|nr:hypothetical protein [Sedimentisphaera salicampi]ARN56927.1 hypothetical protein STSP1_01320 [Sedimentisphaera salicampi]